MMDSGAGTLGPYALDEVHCVDCLEAMRELPDGSVDAVVTDPPYGADWNYESYDDTFEAWIGLMDLFLPQAVRVAKGPVLVPTSKLEGELYLASKSPIGRICWYKGATSVRSAIGFKDWELMYLFGKRPRINIHDHFTAYAENKESPIRKVHPCPKPLEWALWVVKRLVLEGGIVLDPFAGSGTTLVAAKQLGRRFLGFEIDPTYVEIARQRLGQGVLELAGDGDDG